MSSEAEIFDLEETSVILMAIIEGGEREGVSEETIDHLFNEVKKLRMDEILLSLIVKGELLLSEATDGSRDLTMRKPADGEAYRKRIDEVRRKIRNCSVSEKEP